MQITLKSEPSQLNCSVSLETFFQQLQLYGKYADEQNTNIIPRSEYHDVLIQSGDNIEIK